VKVPAAWLIEHAGFTKGYRSAAGAGISANHTLALINGGCTTSELLALGREIRERVQFVFGIGLEREAIVVE
jgi:UDP-N-acetylmuramate dehydrogenase